MIEQPWPARWGASQIQNGLGIMLADALQQGGIPFEPVAGKGDVASAVESKDFVLKIQAGDSLYAIVKRCYGVEASKEIETASNVVCATNRIKNCDHIRRGMELTLPKVIGTVWPLQTAGCAKPSRQRRR